MKNAGAISWSAVDSGEAALIARCVEGDEAACADLVAAHQRTVFNLAFHLLGDRDEALDLSQEVFLRVFRTLSRFRGQSAVRTWIYRIVVNQARNRQRFWRRRHRSQQVSLEEHIRDQFREIVKAGVASFKVFLAYKGALNLSDEHLFAAMKFAKDLGVIVTAHCENADAIDALQKSLLAAGKTGPEWHGPSRPPIVEADGVHHLCTFAELLGTHVYIVHTSCADALREALAARQRGVNVWVESVIPHFVLDDTYVERGQFEGAKYVMSPPLRAKANQDVLWNGIKTRQISTIATDHAPFRFADQKKMGVDAFTKIPNGIPSIQERVDLVHTCGVAAGRLGLQAMVDACSTQAAKLFGLYPRKGAIQLGSDADLVVYDPSYRGTFSKECSYSNVDYNAYEGWEQKGRASVVTVRGKVQARDGEFVGTIGRGQFLKREPTH